MNFSVRKCLGAVAALVLLAAAGGLRAAADNGPLQVVYDPSARQIGVSVVSDSPALQQLMRGAFNLHGAFNPNAAPDSVAYVLRFTQAGQNQVKVTAQAKSGAGSFEVTASGASLTEAAYRAGDAVVQQLTQRPGFFAGKLAFIGKSGKSTELYTSDVLGRAILQQTQDHSITANPRWSPDGTKILYTGYYRSGFPDIILYNLATRERSVFAGYQGTNTGGTFSPDGTHVAMILSSREGSTELFVADADGRNVHRLTHEMSSKSSPTWSPDGAKIILADDPQGYPLLYEISAAGGPLRLVQNKIYSYSAEAAWNPLDPNQLAFMEQLHDGRTQVLLYNFKTGEFKALADDGTEPCWANDGRHIFYTKHVRGVDRLYIVDSITKKDVPLPIASGSDPAFVYVK